MRWTSSANCYLSLVISRVNFMFSVASWNFDRLFGMTRNLPLSSGNIWRKSPNSLSNVCLICLFVDSLITEIPFNIMFQLNQTLWWFVGLPLSHIWCICRQLCKHLFLLQRMRHRNHPGLTLIRSELVVVYNFCSMISDNGLQQLQDPLKAMPGFFHLSYVWQLLTGCDQHEDQHIVPRVSFFLYFVLSQKRQMSSYTLEDVGCCLASHLRCISTSGLGYFSPLHGSEWRLFLTLG